MAIPIFEECSPQRIKRYLAVTGSASLVKGTRNFRDLATFSNGRLRPNFFFRSDNPSAALEAGKGEDLRQKIRTLFDLRSPSECEASPNKALTDKYGIERVPALVDANRYFFTQFGQGPEQKALAYRNILVGAKESFKNILLEMQNRPGPFCFHCNSGLDRTGIISALLLLLAGCTEEEVVADYAASDSQQYLGASTDSYCEKAYGPSSSHIPENLLVRLRSVPREATRWMFSSNERIMRHFLALLREEFGGARGFISSPLGLGLTEESIGRIEAQLQGPGMYDSKL